MNREEQMYQEENYNGVTLTTDSINVIQNQIDLVIRNVDLGFTSSLEAFAVFKELEKRFNYAKKQIDASQTCHTSSPASTWLLPTSLGTLNNLQLFQISSYGVLLSLLS